MTAGRERYELNPFFCTPLHEVDAGGCDLARLRRCRQHLAGYVGSEGFCSLAARTRTGSGRAGSGRAPDGRRITPAR